MSDLEEDTKKSRYVTVLHQTKQTETGEPGDRFIVLGERHNGTHKLDDDKKGFVRVARSLAVIDVGTQLTEDEIGDWCNSHAGQHVLCRYFPDHEPDDPTLPDTEDIRA